MWYVASFYRYFAGVCGDQIIIITGRTLGWIYLHKYFGKGGYGEGGKASPLSGVLPKHIVIEKKPKLFLYVTSPFIKLLFMKSENIYGAI